MSTSTPMMTGSMSVGWNFVSGKVAAQESELLPRSFFEAILKAPNAAEARAALGKSFYRVLFPDDASLTRASAILDARAKEARAELFSLCPRHQLENYFGIGGRFRSFRTLFNSRARETNPQVLELDALFAVFAVEPAFADRMITHRQMLGSKSSPQAASPMERSLYLDSAACTLMRIVAESVSEPLVRQYMSDRAILSAWSGIFRARWNGVEPEMIRDWFIFDGGSEFATSILAVDNEPRAVVGGRLSMTSATALEMLDGARIKADIDAASADVLRETVLSCRRKSFGPERPLSYLVALEAEMANLELCLVTVANGIDRAVTASRLRREYA